MSGHAVWLYESDVCTVQLFFNLTSGWRYAVGFTPLKETWFASIVPDGQRRLKDAIKSYPKMFRLYNAFIMYPLEIYAFPEVPTILGVCLAII